MVLDTWMTAPGEVSLGEMAPGYLSLWLIVAPMNCRRLTVARLSVARWSVAAPMSEKYSCDRLCTAFKDISRLSETVVYWDLTATHFSTCRWATGLHCADFLSLHYIVYESISCNHGTKLNCCQLPSYTHHRATYLSIPPYLSYYNWTLPSFFL